MSRQHDQIDSEVKKTNAERIRQAGSFRFSYWIPVVKESHSISPHRFMTAPVAVAMHLLPQVDKSQFASSDSDKRPSRCRWPPAQTGREHCSARNVANCRNIGQLCYAGQRADGARPEHRPVWTDSAVRVDASLRKSVDFWSSQRADLVNCTRKPFRLKGGVTCVVVLDNLRERVLDLDTYGPGL